MSTLLPPSHEFSLEPLSGVTDPPSSGKETWGGAKASLVGPISGSLSNAGVLTAGYLCHLCHLFLL